PDGQNLQPGQCSPDNFSLREGDPAQIQMEFYGNGSLPGTELYPWEKSYEDANVDASRRLTKFRDYLKDPKNYWSFIVKDSGEGVFMAGSSRYFEPPVVKAVGRVKVPTAPTPPISICEAAREARARNSPAAAGLEAQCRALGDPA